MIRTRSSLSRFHFRSSLALVALLLTTATSTAQAWWDTEYKQRTKVTLNTTAEGVTTSEALSGVAVPLRLHSGNFDFIGAKPDGSDLRVVAADDKTLLKFSVERFDSTGELAVLWVQVPTVAPGTDKNLVYVYAGNPKAAAEPVATVADSGAAATFRFNQTDGAVRDVNGAIAATAPVAIEPNGLIGASARFDGSQPMELPASDAMKAASGAPYSLALWARPTAVAGTLFAQGALSVALDAGKVVVKLGRVQFSGGELPPAAWVHIAVTFGIGKATLYVNGTQAAQVDVPAPAPAIEGAVLVGDNYNGLIDELQVAAELRSAEWVRFARAAQGADALLVASELQREGESASGDGSGQPAYMGVLVKNLTVDAWVVIGICGVMLLIAIWVMIIKAVLVQRTDRGNLAFLAAFRAAPDVMKAGGASTHATSSLARLYDSGIQQLNKRGVGATQVKPLSGASLNAVRAAIEADMVRENQGLNSQIVLLTIAIAGGPFLGLFGTVVGVMITFAAIALAGDVNVNAIAPGIAAALLATVAGLGVAIPSLFGYNYLASRIKNISSDMSIFVDEFITRVAETYGDVAPAAGQTGVAH